MIASQLRRTGASGGGAGQFDDGLFVLFREYVRQRTGLNYALSRRRIFENRIMTRVQARGMPSPEAYYRYLHFGPDRDAEFLQLVSALTNNETFFFREEATLAAIVERAASRRARRRRFRVLSAGASSGEELSTLAILIRERGLDLDEFELFGVDIDVQMVETARAGVYRSKSFRNTDPERMVRFFVPSGDQRKLKPSIHQHLDFRWANLVDAATLRFPHPFDAVMIRNVLIYFDQDTVQQVVKHLHGLLRDDGVLVTGVSESLANVPFLFDPHRENGVVIYQKLAG
ncbi:MAG: protein-glutamate O-methyltransferase CheR [Candidatus Dadabacteria bacterium]|nr:MAG: protein-glutamate O-methyltransferase CheR [Candidatus Dadabacteria bacterium]